MDLIVANNPNPYFRIVGIGAPVYRDLKMGLSHFAPQPERDYLTFRLYRVYRHRLRTSMRTLGTVLEQVEKGTLSDELHGDIFGVYWLG